MRAHAHTWGAAARRRKVDVLCLGAPRRRSRRRGGVLRSIGRALVWKCGARTQGAPEDLLAPLDVWRVDGDHAVKAPGPQQRLVQDVGPVGTGQHLSATAATRTPRDQ